MSQPVPILSVSEVVQPNSAETKENCINAKAREKTINHEMENTLDHGKHEESKLDEKQRETPVNSIQTNCSNDIDAAKLNKQTNSAPNYGVIPPVQVPTATASTIISPNSALVSTNTPSASSNKTPKLNGLKNRIIQRPPPLVLDKVSNFYDNELNGNLNTQAVASTTNATKNASNNQSLPNRVPQLKSLSKSSASNIAKQPASDAESRSIGAANGTNTANEKFWASLNENASRNKALANARASVNNLAQKVGSKETDQAQLQPKDTTDSTNTLGADLVIRHRNSSGSSHLSSGRFVSSVSSKKQERLKGDDNRALSQASHTNAEGEARILRHHLQQRNALNLSNEQDDNDGTNQSEHGGSVGGGGNLIGVDNSTPPAPSVLTINNSGEALSSASSSQPRSNNPFIDNDDEDDGFVSDSRVASRKQQVNHFHKRPASFIAATTTPDKCFKQPILFNYNNNPSQRQPYEGANYFNTKHQDGPIQSNGGFQSNHINHETANDYDSIYVDDCMKSAANEAAYQQASGEEMFKYAPSGSLHRILSNAGKQQKNLAGKKVMEQQTISLDSQSAICRPLPSDTMQLPHWTEAIYELNNAIFDANSVSGGAENGQFIFITESGDIVLELDKVKVSGYTLVEFNELVESKQFHLLSAVQTKHSYGLTHNLKDYLNQSFPKNGADRDLQNSIRENIYRRTIPCTTRPPRPGEVNGVDYRFLTTDQFAELNSAGVLLECGVYAGHYYGTLKPLCDLNILASHRSSNSSKQQAADSIGQNWDANHPAVELPTRREVSHNDRSDPVYENHESIHMYKQSSGLEDTRDSSGLMPINNYQAQDVGSKQNHPNINLPFELPLPPGWEKVADPAHGTYYIDHFTRRTQYERPYEVELTKGSMGFGFTLVEADNGMLLVRSIIQGGPAYLNGHIKPGDILLSAVGISVTGLQHTDVARLFAKFAVGDRVKLTFACSNFAPENIVPDEYVFSNGTNGDLAIAVNPNNAHNQLRLTALPVSNQSPHIMVVNQEFEYINVTLRRGDQGFGFTISDSMAGQRVRKIQNNDTCANLKQGDIIVSMNGEDITKLTHKEVVERLKNCPAGDDVRLTVKRKKRFRSKTPMAMHTNADGEYSLDSTPQRNCKTPSLDGLMLARPVDQNSKDLSRAYRPLFESQLCSDTQQGQFVASKLPPTQQSMLFPLQNINMPVDYAMTGLPIPCPVQLPEQFPVMDSQIYGTLPDASYSVMPNESPFAMSTRQVADQTVYGTIQHSLPVFANNQELSAANRLESIHSIDQTVRDDISNSAQPSEGGSMTNGYHPNNITSIAPQSHQVNLNYQNLMTDPRFDIAARNPSSQNYPSFSQTNNFQSSSYHQLPMYCNTDMVNGHKFNGPNPVLPAKPAMIYPVAQNAHLTTNIYQDNYYANNEELASQPMRYNDLESNQAVATFSLPNEHLIQPMTQDLSQISLLDEQNSDDYEFHHVNLERDNSDSNWGIRLIGGAEVDRAISIGSIVFGGAASKNGLLKSGDEIISINQISVIGATHRHVVELISTCANRVTLVVRRKRFAEACDVVLTRNMDEGFGFVIISSGNCALIGRIIEGSPADRCKQLHVRDRIIAVNGSYITPNMRHPQIVSMIKECGSNLRLRIIPVDCYTVELIKNSQNDNFGFSIRGGSEYDGTPLYILRVAPNGLARDLLNVGDQILEINNIPTVGMTHHQAATIIKYSDPIVKLKLRRNYVTPASLLVDSPRELQKFNQVTAEMISVNQNTTPNLSQVSSSVVNENLSNAASSSNMLAGQLKFGSDVGSDNSVPASNTHNVTRIVSEQQQQQLSVSLPITLDERQQLASDERQQQSEQQSQQQTSSSSLPYGNQSQALYAT